MFNRSGLIRTIAAFIGIAGSVLMLGAAVPSGWHLAGDKPTEYQCGLDEQAAYSGHPSVYLKATKPVEGFGTLMQDFRAEQYLGKRVRLSAFVRAEEVQNWAGLWMRVDKGSSPVEFDNMQDRSIKGTTAWRNYEVVLDVPQDATGIAFGVLLEGSGTVWLNSVRFEVVGNDVPTTGKARRPNQPTNLNFEN